MTNDVSQGRIRARMNRLDNPRAPRMGKIKLGYQVKNCWTCKNAGRKGYAIRAFENVCPNCGGKDFSATFPTKTNHFVFFDDGNPSAGFEAYGKSIKLQFTFKSAPIDCVEIGYVCYQGGKLYCKNRFEPDARNGEFINRNIAVRGGKEIECDPERCPLRAGGNVTIAGKSRTIDPNRPQCGEKVTMYLWLPKCAGFDAYMFQSGSINTINNVQDAVKTLTHFMAPHGGYLPLHLEFILKKQHGMYPDQSGKMIRTEFYSPMIHFPHAFDTLKERMERREITAGDIMYVLPDGLVRPALPGPRDDHYDDLVDGPRSLPEHVQARTDISDLKGVDSPSPESPQRLPDGMYGEIKELANDVMKGMDNKTRAAFKGRFKKTFGLNQLSDAETVSMSKASRIVDWLTAEAEKRTVRDGEDDFKGTAKEVQSDTEGSS